MTPQECAARLATRLAARRRAVFAACRAQGIDDDTRHHLQRTVTGQDSLSTMTAGQLARLLDHLNRAARARGAGDVDSQTIAGDPQLAKIARLLAAQQLPWAYLHQSAGGPSMCRRLTGQDRIEWADGEGKRAVITALVRRAERRPGAPAPRPAPQP